MPKIARKHQKIFASSASNNGVFGSAQVGTKVLSNDLDTLQGLSAFLNGWNDAVISGQRLPPLEEAQTLDYIATYQLAYLFQEGIPEWNTSATYYQNSIVKKTGTYQLYGSIVDNNTGNALPAAVDDANWKYLGDLSAATGVPNGTTTNSGNAYTVTLSPAITSLSQSQLYVVSFNAPNSGAATLNPNAIGATAIRDYQGNALAGGEIQIGRYILSYDGTNLRIITAVPTATTSLKGIVQLATGAEVKTGTDTAKVAPVSAMVQHEGVCKAWVRFNGNGTVAITDSYNVSSVTDNGTGAYTVNFTTSFANANYCFAGMAAWSTATNILVSQHQATAPSTSACRLDVTEASSAMQIDAEKVCAQFFGDQ